MFKIEVVSAAVKSKEVTAKVGGKKYTFHEQEAFAFIPDRDGVIPKYPTKIRIAHDDPKEAYAPGFYTLTPDSFFVGEFDALKIGRLRLAKVAAPALKVG